MTKVKLPPAYRKQDRKTQIEYYINLAQRASGMRCPYLGRIWVVGGSVWTRIRRDGDGVCCMPWPSEVARRIKSGETYLLVETEKHLKEAAEKRKEEVLYDRWTFLQTPEGKRLLEKYEWLKLWTPKKIAEVIAEGVAVPRVTTLKEKSQELSKRLASMRDDSSNTPREKGSTSVPDLIPGSKSNASVENQCPF